MELAKSTLAVVVVAVVAGVVCVVLYLGNWWIFSDSVNRSGRIRQDSFEHQQALISDAQSKATEVALVDVQLASTSGETHVALVNQRQAIVNGACTSIAQITETIPSDLARFNTKECP